MTAPDHEQAERPAKPVNLGEWSDAWHAWAKAEIAWLAAQLAEAQALELELRIDFNRMLAEANDEAKGWHAEWSKVIKRERRLRVVVMAARSLVDDDEWHEHAERVLAGTHSDSEEPRGACPHCGSTTWTWKSAKRSEKAPRCSDCSDSEASG